MKTAIYELKRKFGKPAILRLENQTVNRESGAISQDVEELEISRLIILPLRHGWDRVIGGSTKTNAAHQIGDREFLLDCLDLKGNTFTAKHVIVVDEKQFHVVTFDEYDDCLYIVGRNESQLA